MWSEACVSRAGQIMLELSSCCGSSFRLRGNPCNAVLVELHTNQIWATTDRAVFDVVLLRACGDVEWNDDLLTTGLAEVRSVTVHGSESKWQSDQRRMSHSLNTLRRCAMAGSDVSVKVRSSCLRPVSPSR